MDRSLLNGAQETGMPLSSDAGGCHLASPPLMFLSEDKLPKALALPPPFPHFRFPSLGLPSVWGPAPEEYVFRREESRMPLFPASL